MKRKGLWIVPPNFIGFMTGTKYAIKDGNLITLHYLDGQTETAKVLDYDETWDYFHLVGEIQSKRGREGK